MADVGAIDERQLLSKVEMCFTKVRGQNGALVDALVGGRAV